MPVRMALHLTSNEDSSVGFNIQCSRARKQGRVINRTTLRRLLADPSRFDSHKFERLEPNQVHEILIDLENCMRRPELTIHILVLPKIVQLRQLRESFVKGAIFAFQNLIHLEMNIKNLNAMSTWRICVTLKENSYSLRHIHFLDWAGAFTIWLFGRSLLNRGAQTTLKSFSANSAVSQRPSIKYLLNSLERIAESDSVIVGCLTLHNNKTDISFLEKRFISSVFTKTRFHF